MHKQQLKVGKDGLIPEEEINSTIVVLETLLMIATNEDERLLLNSNIIMLQHIKWCYREIRNYKQREYTLQCMLHSDGKIPYDPDKLN